MGNFFGKIFTKNIGIALILGLSLFGIFKYVEYRLDYISNQLNTKISKLENIIEGTEPKIADVLEQEKEKNSSLLGQVNEITNTVEVLSKLSKTDPELLKKYSKVYFLNEHYVPITLTSIISPYVSSKSKNYQIHDSVLPYLEKMIDAGNNDGVSILVLSAFRSFQTQSILKSSYKVTYGAGTANSFSADQGYSEHQLGTAVDFTTKKTDGMLDGFSRTPEYKWLVENAYKYGFVISYPAGNAYYKFEPWHWRFVGVTLATKLYEEKINFYDLDQRTIDNYLANIFD